MSENRQPSNPDADPEGDRLRAFHLGRLDEGEQLELERRLLEDERLFELSEAVETELTADAVAGGLGEEEGRAFTERLARTQEGRDRLVLARDLVTISGRSASARSDGADRAGQPDNVVPIDRWRSKRLVWRFAAATAACLAGVFVWGEAAVPQAVSLTLAAATRGGGAATVQTVHRTSWLRPVELDVDLGDGEGGETFRSYDVRIVDLATQEVREQNGLHKERRRDGSWILKLGAGRLASGRYQVDVQGETEKGQLEPIGSRDLAVQRP